MMWEGRGRMDWANLGRPYLLVPRFTNRQFKEGVRMPYSFRILKKMSLSDRKYTWSLAMANCPIWSKFRPWSWWPSGHRRQNWMNLLGGIQLPVSAFAEGFFGGVFSGVRKIPMVRWISGVKLPVSFVFHRYFFQWYFSSVSYPVSEDFRSKLPM